MADKGHWVQRLADGTDLQGENLPGIPVVEIAGENRVLIERHSGVLEYGCERICVRVSYGIVCILGSHLELIRMTKQQLIVSGRIDGVQLHRGCK